MHSILTELALLEDLRERGPTTAREAEYLPTPIQGDEQLSNKKYDSL